jgi:hypothetical protein
VKIDFGDVSMNMRNLLRKMGKQSFNPAKKLGMAFLNTKNPETIKFLLRINLTRRFIPTLTQIFY